MSSQGGVPSRPRFIAIEGTIGAGKTTLAHRLAASLDARLLLERPQDNPFLPAFYRDPARAALPTQLSFLLQRVSQVEELHQRDLFNQVWVADFLFDKDRLFAELTLSRPDYGIYRAVFDRLAVDVPPADCVIHLQAPTGTLMQRIAQRGRDYESDIDPGYLDRLSLAYGRYFQQATAPRVIEVDTASLDLVGEPAHYRLLLDALASGERRLRLPESSLL